MLLDLMQCLPFALIKLVMSYLKSFFWQKTTLIFSRHSLSHEVCMIYLDCHWLSTYQLLFVGVATLSQLGTWIFLLMAIKIGNFRCYLCCASMENLFTIHIFETSTKICTCPCIFRAQLLLTKIRLINAKSQIQPRWPPSFSETLEKSKLSTIISGQLLCIFKNFLCRIVPCYLVHLTA